MQTNRQIAGWLTHAIEGVARRPPLRFTLMLGGGLLLAPAIAAAAQATKADSARANTAAQSVTADAHTCLGCHAQEVKSFANSPHAQPAMTQDGKSLTCASCHGPGKAHVDSGGDKTKIFDPAQAAAKQVDAMCLGCHQGTHPTFEQSAHGKSDVSCISCHSVHSAGAPRHLLKVAEPRLCLSCHEDVKPEFAMPYHHKVEEGLITCSDCHDPHSTHEPSALQSFARQDTVCTNCHTRMAGPFKYEHPAVKAAGCTTCHFPHGGPNPHLLVKADVNSLCRLCHFPKVTAATEAHQLPTNPQAKPAKPCTDCHTRVHGSNTSAAFLRKKQ